MLRNRWPIQQLWGVSLNLWHSLEEAVVFKYKNIISSVKNNKEIEHDRRNVYTQWWLQTINSYKYNIQILYIIQKPRWRHKIEGHLGILIHDKTFFEWVQGVKLEGGYWVLQTMPGKQVTSVLLIGDLFWNTVYSNQ